jgi:hypothetical protein
VAVIVLWVARWLALELASYAGHRLLKPKPFAERDALIP